ncbi:hypothetical protein RRG08_047499 [Elysia crispata]|uniref:Uncharacterized protein n=1 Tax=Elysia crispata TaxID=231223 RepID=A0AAE0XWY6_9GAST|nr:hypothetical protein RRG08_047499 [Elysia crispata]
MKPATFEISTIQSASPHTPSEIILDQRVAWNLVPFLPYVHTVEITYAACVLLSILGIFTNAASLKTFFAIGDIFKDSVSLTFFYHDLKRPLCVLLVLLLGC